jgi:hypothetical protein
MITKQQQLKFYKSELDALENEVEQLFNSPALALLEMGDLFLGIYRGYDSKRGNIFISFKNEIGRKTPRLDFPYSCFVLSEDVKYPKLWGSKTYRNLLQGLNSAVDISDIKLVNYMADETSGLVKGVCVDVGYEFVQNLQPGQLLGIGPTEPPFEYLLNLYRLTELILEKRSDMWEIFLEDGLLHAADEERFPKIVEDGIDLPQMLLEELEQHPAVILQGPPGTGKTHTIADLLKRLALRNKSVIVASQSNQSVVEVCNKPFLNDLMREGRVFKTNLLSNEKSKFPHLEPLKDIYPEPGKIILTTYYQFSKTWIEFAEQVFDYVIIEESSQAFLTTISGALKIGKKVLIVGDPYQLQPIVINPDPTKISAEIYQLVNGLESLCNNPNIPYFRVIGSYRLNRRSVDYTNEFYQKTLVSKVDEEVKEKSSSVLQGFEELLNTSGGPVMIKIDLSGTGKDVPQLVNFLAQFIDFIKYLDSKHEISVLTPFKKTLSFLQRELNVRTKNKAYRVETVDRVQGMDVDYCFFVIPDDNLVHALNRNRFNVATSRAKKATIIITDKKITQRMTGHPDVLRYLSRLETEFSFEI